MDYTVHYKIMFKDGSEYSDTEYYFDVNRDDIRDLFELGWDIDQVDYICLWDDDGHEY